MYRDCTVKIERVWKGVFESNLMFESYVKMIKTAKKFLYFEHQYPFQNGALTYYMCDALCRNPDLLVYFFLLKIFIYIFV